MNGTKNVNSSVEIRKALKKSFLISVAYVKPLRIGIENAINQCKVQ